jgi:hypothetical protein
MRKSLTIFKVAGIHFLLTLFSAAFSLGITMSVFDTSRSLTLMEQSIEAISEALIFPLGTLYLYCVDLKIIPRFPELIALVFNSLLWGIFIHLVMSAIARRKHK